MSPLKGTFKPGQARPVAFGAILALALVAVVAVILVLSSQPTAAQSAQGEVVWMTGYVQFPNINGDATEPQHVAWCELQSFDQGVLAAAPAGTSGGAAAGKPQFEDIILVKYLDRASPKLQEAAVVGRYFPTVKIELMRLGEQTSTPLYLYKLSDVVITHYNVGTTGQRDVTPAGLPRVELGGPTIDYGLPVEELALSFRKIEVTYFPVKPDGSAEPGVIFEWDLAGNKTR